MIFIEEVSVYGFQEAIRGMRNPMNSWDKSDSGFCKNDNDGVECSNCVKQVCNNICDRSFKIGENDYDLMMTLRNAGTDHRKFMRMLIVYADITAPLYWWKEFDTYKVGTVANSCSTMHKIQDKEFTVKDFSHEHLFGRDDLKWGDVVPSAVLDSVIHALNTYRKKYLETNDKRYWWQMIQLLPSSYNQKRTVMLNYEVLANIYKSRWNHKLDEWYSFCVWIKNLPYSELIDDIKTFDLLKLSMWAGIIPVKGE